MNRIANKIIIQLYDDGKYELKAKELVFVIG